MYFYAAIDCVFAEHDVYCSRDCLPYSQVVLILCIVKVICWSGYLLCKLSTPHLSGLPNFQARQLLPVNISVAM